LQISIHNYRFASTVVRTLFGCGFFMCLSMPARAQTYYYYPASAPAAPTVTPGTPTTWTGFWRGNRANQVVWYTYAPQYYQPTYTNQTPQTYYTPQYTPTTYQAETVQTAAPAQPSRPAQPAVSEAAPAAPAVAVAEVGDPYGFVSWLNATRASYGLSAVGYDANLTNWAAMNNDQQAARGMGHFVMGPARRQNSAMGAFANIGSMWMNSPAHRAALLDPTITAIGIAGLGAYWTFNAY
jgi:uncharacterized protein YkwD